MERVSSSASLKYSPLGRPLFEQVYLAFLGNRNLCHSFLRDCADYGKNVLDWCPASVASPTSSRRVGASHNLRERSTRLRSEVSDVSTENAASAQGLSSYRLMPMSPLTSGHFYLLFSRAAEVRNYLQQGPNFRTEDGFWIDPRIEHLAR